jgi:hypothetical protein
LAATSVSEHVEKKHAFKFRIPYISPGIYCPSGYTTAKAFTLTSPGVETTPLTAVLLRTAGTHVQCCPRYDIQVLCNS